MPNRPLALLAAHLRRLGHDSPIRDYGTIEQLERTIHRNGRFRSAEKPLRRVVEHDLAAGLRTDYVLIRIESDSDLPWVRRLAANLAKGDRHPAVVIWSDQHGGIARTGIPYRHWTGSNVSGLATALDHLGTGDELDPCGITDENGVAPDYSAPVYRSLHDETMVRIFTVAQIAKIRQNVRQASVLRQRWRDTGVATAIREIKSLSRSIAAGAFQIDCVAEGAAERFALALKTNGLSMAYACRGGVNCFSPSAMAALAHTGCRAISVQSHSGSQRLLDDLFSAGWTVTDTERVLRAARFQDLYTVAEFDCPPDHEDYHTAAETDRLIRRATPNSVLDHSRSAREAGVTSTDGLMAALAGHQGDEAAFTRAIARQFRSMDIDALRAAVDCVNAGAEAAARATATPYTLSALPDAIGN